MLVLTDCSILLGAFTLNLTPQNQNNYHAFKFKNALILKMIAVFTALKMPLSIRVQRLFL